MGDGIIGAAAQLGQAIRVGDVRKDPRYLPAAEEVRSELAVPLIVRGRVIGVMDIESRQPDYFTPGQQTILTLVASRIGTAVENARLFESARKQAETLLLLNEIGRETSATLRSRRGSSPRRGDDQAPDRLPDFQHPAVRSSRPASFATTSP